MSCQKSTRLNRVTASDNHAYGQPEDEDPASGKTLTCPLFPSPAANALLTDNVHELLNPFICFSGGSAKSRHLEKLSHPSLLNRQVKTVIIISGPKLPDFGRFFANSGCFCGWGAIL